MIFRTRGQELRLNMFTNASRIPRWGYAVDEFTGANVTTESAAGLPAVAAAIRLTSETLGMTPLIIYKDKGEGERERARQTWQWDLLHDAPSPDFAAFDFFTDIGTSIESTGDAFVFKVKVQRQVVALYVVEPTLVTIKRDKQKRKVYEISNPEGKETFTSSEILHIRGWTISPGADRGVSPISLHRHSLGASLAQEAYQGTFYKQGGVPPYAIELPVEANRVSEADLERMRDRIVERHSGLANAHKPAILRFGATLKPSGISQKDAEFIASRKWNIEDIARIFRISSVSMLSAVMEGSPTTAQDFERFLKVDMGPRYRRIEQAFKRDRDLFPQTSTFPEFLADSVLRPDVKTRYEAYRLARQGGWLAPNEIREIENFAPKDGGDDIQLTPVGGAENPGQSNEPSEQDEPA